MNFNYHALGEGDAYIKDGEFIVISLHGVHEAAKDFIEAHGCKPEVVDTGFMGIHGHLLLDTNHIPKMDDVEYPCAIKLHLKANEKGHIAVLASWFSLWKLRKLHDKLIR